MENARLNLKKLPIFLLPIFLVAACNAEQVAEGDKQVKAGEAAKALGIESYSVVDVGDHAEVTLLASGNVEAGFLYLDHNPVSSPWIQISGDSRTVVLDMNDSSPRVWVDGADSTTSAPTEMESVDRHLRLFAATIADVHPDQFAQNPSFVSSTQGQIGVPVQPRSKPSCDFWYYCCENNQDNNTGLMCCIMYLWKCGEGGGAGGGSSGAGDEE